jgi:hypothetical protein
LRFITVSTEATENNRNELNTVVNCCVQLFVF